jgi:hypothetical protein
MAVLGEAEERLLDLIGKVALEHDAPHAEGDQLWLWADAELGLARSQYVDVLKSLARQGLISFTQSGGSPPSRITPSVVGMDRAFFRVSPAYGDLRRRVTCDLLSRADPSGSSIASHLNESSMVVRQILKSFASGGVVRIHENGVNVTVIEQNDSALAAICHQR